jgi:3-oxoacyl-[acyl-carrier protein] reductase
VDLGLAGKVVVVTAASDGLGKAIAAEFAGDGAQVSMSARNFAKLERAADEIAAQTGIRPHVQVADNLIEADAAALVAGTVARFGRIDVMLCNSVGPATAPFELMGDDAWRDAMETKVIAQLRFAREAFKAMQAQRSGVILFMAGTHGRQPGAYSVTAGVSNAALINASKALAEAAAPYNIRVNAINPGPIDTARMTYLVGEKARQTGVSDAEAKRILADVTVLKRFGEPAEVAAPVVFLASERASFITGIMFDIDGGQVRAI